MRAIFSTIALLLVVLTIGLLVKKQLSPSQHQPASLGNSDPAISQPTSTISPGLGRDTLEQNSSTTA